MNNIALKKTPLYSKHLELKARMVPFAGYEMPVQYQGVLEETKTCRKDVGIFDVSHMGQFSVRGASALEEVQKLVSNDLARLKLGQAQYNMLCNESGGVIDDLVVYRRAEDWIYICVNASNRDLDKKWITERLSNRVSFLDESDETALLAVQGPKAEKLLASLTSSQTITSLKYYWAVEGTIDEFPCYISRTGYTGEDGFELYTQAKYAADLWDSLLDKGKTSNLVPCGLGARDTLRLEMGYPLHGHELSQEISPLQAGLSWAVKLQKSPPFFGQSALQKEAQQGSSRLIRGYRIQDRRIARQGYAIFDKTGNRVGTITSGTHSPHLEAPVALGLVERISSDEGTLWVDIRGSKIEMTKVPLPFVTPHTKKV